MSPGTASATRRFEHTAAGIESRLTQFVAGDDPVKVSILALKNTGSKERRLSVTMFCEWVLGPSRMAGIPFIRTELSASTGALLARNSWNRDYGSDVAFLDLGGLQQSWTGDRSEFIGRVGRIDEPAALRDGRPALRSRRGFARPLRRHADRGDACPRDEHADRHSPRPGILSAGSRSPRRALSERRPRRGARGGEGALARTPRCRAGRDARPRPRPHAQRLAPLSGHWPAGSGRVRASTRRAAPMAFATSSRIPWRSC